MEDKQIEETTGKMTLIREMTIEEAKKALHEAEEILKQDLHEYDKYSFA